MNVLSVLSENHLKLFNLKAIPFSPILLIRSNSQNAIIKCRLIFVNKWLSQCVISLELALFLEKKPCWQLYWSLLNKTQIPVNVSPPNKSKPVLVLMDMNCTGTFFSFSIIFLDKFVPVSWFCFYNWVLKTQMTFSWPYSHTEWLTFPQTTPFRSQHHNWILSSGDNLLQSIRISFQRFHQVSRVSVKSIWFDFPVSHPGVYEAQLWYNYWTKTYMGSHLFVSTFRHLYTVSLSDK